MKKILIFRAGGNSSWIGGLYYIKNIVFMVLQNKTICDDYDIHIYVEKESEALFLGFKNKAKVIVYNNKTRWNKMFLYLKFFDFRVKYIFYMGTAKYDFLFGKKSVYWIADFQHCYYPNYFSKEAIDMRNDMYYKIGLGKGKLVLSSQNSKNDFQRYYPNSTVKTFVMPFVSYIESEIKDLKEEEEIAVLEKFNIEKNTYFCISNQFWQHKNHIVVLQAIKKLIKEKNISMKFVFTGQLADDRNEDYVIKIRDLFAEEEIARVVKILGFINRKEQLIVMKCAKCIIQPSLFEGWGTVLEDAKVLDKEVILSDIPIHREQMNHRCHLFQPDDSDELADLIIKVKELQLQSDCKLGIRNMYERAADYTKELERLLEC